MFLAMAVLSIAHKNENSVEKQSVGTLTSKDRNASRGLYEKKICEIKVHSTQEIQRLKNGRIDMRKRSLRKQSSTADNGCAST